MIAQLTIAYFLFLFVFLPLIRAELVGQLRQRYQEGREIASNIEDP